MRGIDQELQDGLGGDQSPPAEKSRFGPGLITGAADDDPSGIATYSQVGAQFGLNMLWTVVLTYPLMTAIQMISARIGRVTGAGLAANMKLVFPGSLASGLVALLFIANAINIGADLAAMGAAVFLIFGGNAKIYAILLALGSLSLQIFLPYHRYVHVLKWLTLALFAYVGVLFTLKIDWLEVLGAVVWPQFTLTAATFTAIVAVFGTTISPYLFFWQSSEEVEDQELDSTTGPLLSHPADAAKQLNRIGWDTYVGMAASNIIAFMIILTAAVTLHREGITDIATSADAAEALRPIAGDFAFMLFALGIIGTGLLALPVLSGSVAYAVGELRGWTTGLERKPDEARGFYGIIALSFAVGLLVLFLPLDPIRLLFWSAVLNGVIAVPIMVAMMIIVSSKRHLGDFVATRSLKIFGWAATVVMAAAATAMFIF